MMIKSEEGCWCLLSIFVIYSGSKCQSFAHKTDAGFKSSMHAWSCVAIVHGVSYKLLCYMVHATASAFAACTFQLF